ncbi:NAD(P)H-binding protein [Streptomyces erythrochromogenes]|uniref:NAD(P)H-binding protein n=1 Tax=Streptomyces erythrochromogenes TaxID=285574 RepID=UPI003680F121
MILVTGATGTVGREVVGRLPAGSAVRVMTRDPARAPDSVAAEVVRGDYDDPRSLARAVQGVRAVFLVTNRVGSDDDARFVEAARSAGVRHVVKLSAAAVADPLAQDLITCWQRGNEALLRGSGMEWTLLRPRAFMSNTLSWAPAIRSEQVVRALYGSSPTACVDPRDIAEVAVRALTEGGHAGRAHTLTGPEPITAAEQTAQLAELLGRPLRFEEAEVAQMRAALRARHPDTVTEALLESAERRREGGKSEVEGAVREILGRPAGSFRAWAADHLSAFSAG